MSLSPCQYVSHCATNWNALRTDNYHLKKVFVDSALEEEAVIRNFRITASDGKIYKVIRQIESEQKSEDDGE